MLEKCSLGCLGKILKKNHARVMTVSAPPPLRGGPDPMTVLGAAPLTTF